jgi:hypothetical protein
MNTGAIRCRWADKGSGVQMFWVQRFRVFGFTVICTVDTQITQNRHGISNIEQGIMNAEEGIVNSEK